MAFRFRKSFKLAPGVRMNLSTRGASLSLGGRGFTTNLSSRGVRQTVSVPGTGISWSETYRASTATGSRASRELARARREAQYQEALQVVEQEEERLRDVIEDWRAMPDIPDQSTIAAALQLRSYEATSTPPVLDLDRAKHDLSGTIRENVAPQHSKLPFYIAFGLLSVGIVHFAMTGDGVLAGPAFLIFLIAVPPWAIWRLVKIARQVREQTEGRWPEVEQAARARHEAALREFQEREAETRRNWEQTEHARVDALRRLLAGEPASVDEAVQEALEDLDFPFEATCSASVLSDGTVGVVVDLPELEDVIPETRSKALKNGTLKQVRLSLRDRREAWRHLVLGIALQLGRTVCAAAPSVPRVRIAGYSQRRQRTGLIADEWVYELPLDRPFLATLRPESVDPSTLLRLPDARVLPMADGNLKKIPAPAWVDEVAAE